MEIKVLIDMIDRQLSTREMADELDKSQSSIIYWFKKYGLKSKNKDKNDDNRVCPRCKIKKQLNDFYKKRGKVGTSSYCKICTNEQTTERSKAFKKKAVEYKGGSCEKCGYNKSMSALEFHHLDPNEKDFSLGGIKLNNLTDKIKNELNKCILVCSNCHREIHDELNII